MEPTVEKLIEKLVDKLDISPEQLQEKYKLSNSQVSQWKSREKKAIKSGTKRRNIPTKLLAVCIENGVSIDEAVGLPPRIKYAYGDKLENMLQDYLKLSGDNKTKIIILKKILSEVFNIPSIDLFPQSHRQDLMPTQKSLPGSHKHILIEESLCSITGDFI